MLLLPESKIQPVPEKWKSFKKPEVHLSTKEITIITILSDGTVSKETYKFNFVNGQIFTTIETKKPYVS